MTPRSLGQQPSTPTDDWNRDGNWWLQLAEDARPTYLIGFMDGTDLGYQFTYWGIKNPKKDPCTSQEQNSYNAMVQKYFSSVTAGQLKDRLDNFYKEPLNRPIEIAGAVWFALQEIAGVPKEQLDKYVENARKNAPLMRTQPLSK